MIVVDTNVIAYLFLPGVHTEKARAAFKDDADWCVPVLWRSEFRNVLAFYLRNKSMDFDTAAVIVHEAEKLLESREYRVASSAVFSFVVQSACSAYDCEFIALAEELQTKLVTSDKQLLKEFPARTIPLSDYGR